MTSLPYIVKADSLLYLLITNELSDQSTKRYKNGSFTLSELDEWTRDTLPKDLSYRYDMGGPVKLFKDELILLMEWKLAKGKFRTSLPKWIKSNSQGDVIDITTEGFGILLDYFTKVHNRVNWESSEERKEYVDVVRKSVKKLTELRGVGPATASLMLSLLGGINKYLTPPFFSDESFLYLVVDNIRPGTKIKYTLKEYTDELLPKYFEMLQTDVDLHMNQLEKGCWALKMYDIYKIDKLMDIKLPFEVSDDVLHKYCEGQKKEVKEEKEPEIDEPPKKRKRTTK